MRKIQSQRLLEEPGRMQSLPLVCLEDFFDGNDDFGSIGCNLPDEVHPGPIGFYSVLKSIQERSDVQHVLVEIYETSNGNWPYSERIYVLTSADQDSVEKWLASLRPDAVDEHLPWYGLSKVLSVHSDIKIYAAWWD